MMSGVKRHRECAEGMTQPAVDNVFQESPSEYARDEPGEVLDHETSLADRGQ